MDTETSNEREEALAQGRREFSVKQAQEDIEDIRELRQSPWFQRYFVRRIQQKRDVIAGEIMSGEGISDYVTYRMKLANYQFANEILNMPAADQMAAHKDLHPNQTEN